MSLMKSMALLIVVGVSCGCGLLERPASDPRATAAVVVNKNEPPAGCRYLGEVTGDVIIGRLETARQELMKNAVEGGGNYVAVDMTERHPGGYGMIGRLFQCPADSAPASEAIANMPPRAPVAAIDER